MQPLSASLEIAVGPQQALGFGPGGKDPALGRQHNRPDVRIASRSRVKGVQ